jgi:hypothetical protein
MPNDSFLDVTHRYPKKNKFTQRRRRIAEARGGRPCTNGIGTRECLQTATTINNWVVLIKTLAYPRVFPGRRLAEKFLE